jgi:hypothetical protein
LIYLAIRFFSPPNSRHYATPMPPSPLFSLAIFVTRCAPADALILMKADITRLHAVRLLAAFAAAIFIPPPVFTPSPRQLIFFSSY